MTNRTRYGRVGSRRIGSSTAGGGGGGTIADNSVTNAKLAQAPASTLKGNNTAGFANVADLTAAQVRALLALGSAALANTGAFDAAGAAAAAQAASQPLDSDLTAIAALATTSFGRGLLALADQAALRAAIGLGTAAFQSTAAFDAAGAAASAQAASQPLDADLTAIAALTTTTFGRALLALADQSALLGAAGLSGDFYTYCDKATVCLATTNLWHWWDDFDETAAGSTGPLGWVQDANNATFATFNTGSTESGGIEYSTIPAIATSRANLYIKAQLFSVGNKDLYVAVKQKCTTALGTNQIFGMSITDTSLVANSFGMGFMNSLNPNNFIVAYGGSWLTGGVTTAIDLGVAKDTAYHVWEIWTRGTDLFARLDGGGTFTAVGVAGGWGTKSAGVLSVLVNGAAGAAMGRETSWILARGVR
jgi:hypothetical protein